MRSARRPLPRLARLCLTSTATRGTSTSQKPEHEHSLGGYQSHFERLGVGEGASRAEVRAAFLSLAKRLHPDVSTKDLAAAQRDFVALKAAYDVLSDAESRARYTATLRRGGKSHPESHDDDGQGVHSHYHARAHSQHHNQQQRQQQRGAKTDLVSYTVGTWAQLEMELEVTAARTPTSSLT